MTFLNIGAGNVRPGDPWINADPYPEDVPGPCVIADPLRSLPWPDGFFAGAVAHHVLMMVDWVDLPVWLAEVRRVTAGPLRVTVPDIRSAVDAWLNGSSAWFPLSEPTVDDQFCRYVTQGGATRSIFTHRRLHDLLTEHYGQVRPVVFGETWLPGLDALDSRQAESIVMEAR